MKLVVISMVGNIGKSTLAANMFMPRLKNPKFFSIETINSGAEMDGVEVEKMKGKNFGDLTDEIMRLDSAIIDVGTTNFDDFIKLMQQFSGSQEEFDYFVVPVVKDEKSQRDTVKTLRQLKALGVDKKRVRVVFNQVEVDDDVENDFAAIFGLCESEKCATVNKNAVVYKNEVFDRIKSFGKPLGDIFDVRFFDAAVIFKAQKVFKQNLHREREFGYTFKTVLFSFGQAVINIVFATSLKLIILYCPHRCSV